MFKCLLLSVCFAGVLTLPVDNGKSSEPIHIIKPPVRCPEGMKPDANGRCRVVWEKRNVDLCPEGEEPDDDGACQKIENLECLGEECEKIKILDKREVKEPDEDTEAIKPFRKHRRMEALKSEKKIKKRSHPDDAAKQARSKHAFLIMLKKKKMQMMKPKPPPPPPHHPHHHPPHEESEEPEEEEPEEEPEQPARLFFGNELCIETENSTEKCQSDAELVNTQESNKEFKEWKPVVSAESSESSSSSSSSSSSDSTGESDSESDSESEGETEDEVLEKAFKIKLLKLFRMRQKYGPTFRRWLSDQMKEFENSFTR